MSNTKTIINLVKKNPSSGKFLIETHPLHQVMDLTVERMSSDFLEWEFSATPGITNTTMFGTHMGSILFHLTDLLTPIFLGILPDGAICFDYETKIEFKNASNQKVFCNYLISKEEASKAIKSLLNTGMCILEKKLTVHEADGKIVAIAHKKLYMKANVHSKN